MTIRFELDGAISFKSDRHFQRFLSYSRRSGRTMIVRFRNDGQQQVRWPLGIPIDLVGHGLAAANVVGDILDIGHRSSADRYVHGCDVEADPVPGFELVQPPRRVAAAQSTGSPNGKDSISFIAFLVAANPFRFATGWRP